MADIALPTQGTKALIRSWGDANAEMIRNGNKGKKKASSETQKKSRSK